MKDPIKEQAFISFLGNSKRLFWDMELSKLHPIKSKRIIIERIVTRGDLPDFKQAIDFYGKSVIIKEITRAGDLDKKTLNWLSLIFEIPLTQFLCYTKRQSNRQHWTS